MVQSQVLELSPAPSNAEQSLIAHGLSSVYDPNQEAEEQTAKQNGSAGAVIARSASPIEAIDNRFVVAGCWLGLPANGSLTLL